MNVLFLNEQFLKEERWSRSIDRLIWKFGKRQQRGERISLWLVIHALAGSGGDREYKFELNP
jgi:hypothetical protein